MNAKCSILSLALLAAWLSAAGTEPTNVVVHWQSTSPSGASRIATAAYYDGLGRHVASVAEDASPDGGDIVEIKEYDVAGIITIKFGHIEGSGEFVNGTITYSENLGEATYIEELIHAFQYVFGQMDDPTINKEYEAKLIAETIFSEISPNIGYANTALLRNPLLFDYFYDLNKGKLLLDPINRLNSKAYHEEYRKYGNIFTNYYKHAEPDESNYHVPTTAPSRLFVNLFGCYKIINFLMNTFK